MLNEARLSIFFRLTYKSNCAEILNLDLVKEKLDGAYNIKPDNLSSFEYVTLF